MVPSGRTSYCGCGSVCGLSRPKLTFLVGLLPGLLSLTGVDLKLEEVPPTSPLPNTNSKKDK
jgi:hypothetical protein